MTIETLHIRNFAGLTDVKLELKPVTVLIGPQASGKSVSAKLAFFFKEIVRRLPLHVVEESSKAELEAGNRRLFLSYFPPESWSSGKFKITYKCGKLTISARRKNSGSAAVELTYSNYFNDLLEAGYAAREHEHDSWNADSALDRLLAVETVHVAIREQIATDLSPTLTNECYFIPAGRSFFATFRSSIFSLLSASAEIDPFLVEFGRFYEQIRRYFWRDAFQWGISPLAPRIDALLGGRYIALRDEDYIQMADGRQVRMTVASSGQQELLPLLLALATVGGNNVLSGQRTVFVEEPEAHLFPTAQRQIVHLFAVAIDLLSPGSSSQYIITTHSPYILTALNNLVYGGKVARENAEKRDEVIGLLGPDVLIDPEKVAAYSMENGRARSIIDPETQLVEATLIDRVSGELAREFEQLVAIEFGGDAD